MKAEGNIRKMVTTLGEKAEYALPLYDITEKKEAIPLNEFVGKKVKLSFTNEIHCVVSGKRIKKAYGEGMSYDVFRKSPLAVESIIRPELSRIHEGIALRDKEWEEKHHLQPHTVYLSLTSGVKVGVTRSTQIPTRWIDQGAVAAIAIANTPYRQAAGLIEVALKDNFADKTNWRNMLTNTVDETVDLLEQKESALDFLTEDLAQYGISDSEVQKIDYPVLEYPSKVKSLKLDKVPTIENTLIGIKGQYWLFENGEVINIRSHAGYRVVFEA